MKKLLLPIFAFTVMIYCSGCLYNSADETDIQFTGTVQQQGITWYMYGSHTISDGFAIYALRSSAINLDDYIGDEVKIKGNFVEGYPIDDGPMYIEVTTVE